MLFKELHKINKKQMYLRMVSNVVIGKSGVLKLNSFIIAVFLFQFSLLMGVNALMGTQVLFIIITAMFCFMLLLFNKLKAATMKYLLVSTTVFFVGIILSSSNLGTCLEYYGKFLAYGFTAFFVGTFEFDEKSLLNYIKVCSYLSLCFLLPLPYLKLNGEYMRYGYALLPCVITFFHIFVIEKNIVALLSFLIAFASMAIYGARGASFSFLLYLGLYVLFNEYKYGCIKKIIGIITIILLCVFLNVYSIVLLEFINQLLETQGINSYAFNKYMMMLEKGVLASSSGRDAIFESILQSLEGNWLLGNGLLSVQQNTGFYAHNIFLQMLSDYGLLGLLIIVGLFIYISYLLFFVIRKRNPNLYYIVLMLYSISFGRLLLSSDIWVRTEFWLMVSIILFNFEKKQVNSVTSFGR